MSTKLTGEDVCNLNAEIISVNKEISQKAQRKLKEYVRHPECFADAVAEDWAKRIARRIAGTVA